MSVLWSPALLRQVLTRTENGDLSLLGDLCDQIVADDRFGELLGQLADDVIGSDLTFEKSLRTIVGSAEKSDELTVDWPLGYDDDECKNLIIWTMLTGIGFAKHETWIDTEKGRVVPSLKWWHPQHFSFRPKNNAPFLLGGDLRNHAWHVRKPGLDTWEEISPGDGTWVIVTRRSEYRPWASGLWRGLAVWWLLKQFAMQDSGVHTEKSSKIVVKSETDASTAEERRALVQYIYDSGKDAVIALPQGYDMSLLEVKADLDHLYHSQIRLANDSAALAILGQNLSTNVEGGSLAATKEHAKKENRRVRNAAQMLSKALRSQSLTWWAEFNFGDSALAPYPHWHTEPEEDYAAKATSLQTIATALLTLKTANWEIDEETIEEEFGVTLRKTKALDARENAEPGDTDGDGIPHNEPGNVGNPDSGVPKSSPGPGEKPPKRAPPSAKPRRLQPPKPPTAQTSFLASDEPAEAAGFIRGQIYTDALTDKTTALAADQLSGFLDKIYKAIDGAEDYETLRYRIVKAFQGQADPTTLARIIEKALLLANLAGRNSVMEDVPE